MLPLFTSKNQELLTGKAMPASSICLSGWHRRKRNCMLLKEEAGWDNSEIYKVKTKLVQGVLQSAIIRVPFFFCSNDFNYWRALFFNMQIKRFGT